MNGLTAVESVARRYANRPGCRFVGAREVGITVFLMDLRAVIVEPKDVPPVDEFLLRSLGLEVDSPTELSEFLGLDIRTIENRLVELRRAELIELIPAEDPGSVRCRLTSRGHAVAGCLERAELRELTIPRVVYHGFCRRPILVTEEALLRPRDLKALGLPTIPAMPSRHPRPEEIKLEDLAPVLRGRWQRRRNGKPPELVTVRSVLRDVRTMYLRAVLLQYELTGTRGQKLVTFAVDGVVDEDAGRAFAARGGPDKIPDILAGRFTSTAELAGELMPPHVVQRLGNLADVDELVEKFEEASAKLSEIEAAPPQATDRPDTKQILRQEVEQLRAVKADLERKLGERKARRLRTYDCRALLVNSVRVARERLVIVSAFLSAKVIDRDFVKDLDRALARGVKVWIAYGMGEQGGRQAERERSWDWVEAEDRLRELAARHPAAFYLADMGNTHAKILLRDRDFVVSGSFNWLSFRGDRNQPHRDEDGIQVTEPQLIEEYFSEITSRFKPG